MIYEAPGGAPAPLLEGRFTGRGAFAELVRQALATAAMQGWREIIVCDPDFALWPLGERAVAQALNDWSRGGRKLTMLAANYDTVLRQHARFVVWRNQWSHTVQCRRQASGAAAASGLPSALWSSGWTLERLDLNRCIGVAGSEAARRSALKERLAEHLSNSASALPSRILGL